MNVPAFSQSFRGNSAALAEDVRVTVWIDRDTVPLPPLGQEWNETGNERTSQVPDPDDPNIQSYRDLLDLARTLISGFIYGFTFSYVPPDQARSVQEYFEMIPRGQIPWGDPALEIEHRQDHGFTTEITFRYRLDPYQQDLRRSWLGVSVGDSAGSGSAPMAQSIQGQQQALERASLLAVRAYAQGLTYDKPAEVSGTFAFTNPPLFRLVAGQYHTDVRTQVRVSSIRHYRVF